VQHLSGADATVEGAAYELALNASGAAGAVRWIVDWGDGSPKAAAAGKFATLTHVFLDDSSGRENGAFVIRATIIDDDGAYVASKPVTVHNVTPTLQAVVSGPILEGGKGTLSLSAPDPGEDAVWAWRVDWGDGTIETLPGFTTLAEHTYADDGVYPVGVTATDEDGTYTADPPAVSVANVAPVARLIGPTAVDEGGGFTLVIDSPTDPGDDTVTHYMIHWGDGSEETVEAPVPYGNGVTPPLAVGHVYADGDAGYGITVRLLDEDGTHDNDVGLAVHVGNVAPSLTVAGASSVKEGDEYTLTIQPAFDPGDDTVVRFIVHWGDGRSNTVSTPGPLTHVYRGQGARLITVDIEDDDGLHVGVVERRLIVVDVPPSVQLGGEAAIDEGGTYDLMLGGVVDPGDPGALVTVNEYRVHWGDGTISSVVAAGGIQHVYQDGYFAAAITVDLVTDDGLVRNAGVRPLLVRNVAPKASITGVPDEAYDGLPIDLSALIGDPSPADLAAGFTCAWSVTKDGQIVAEGTGLQFRFTPGQPGTHVAMVNVTDKDGGAGLATANMTVLPAATSALSGVVWVDFNNDGLMNFGESGLSNVCVEVTGTDDLGNSVQRSVYTDDSGNYVFAGLRRGLYALHESQPADYEDGQDVVGDAGGTIAENDVVSAIVLANDQQSSGYNFGERPVADGPVQSDQVAGIGFWHNKRGQALIRSLNGGPDATQLGNWLAATFPGLYGSLAGKSNEQVARYYETLFASKGPKLEAQVMALALSVYVTNASLVQSTASHYGFMVTEYGVGVSTFHIGSFGAALGRHDGSIMTVMDILLAADQHAVGGVLFGGDRLLRELANRLFSAINEAQ
jgi:hypothetical protein